MGYFRTMRRVSRAITMTKALNAANSTPAKGAVRMTHARMNTNKLFTATSVALGLLLWPVWAAAQGTIMPVPHQVFLSNAGAPLNNAKICTYSAGTTTPLSTYSDEALTVELPNPIRTNSAGRPQNGSGTETNVYWSAASYRIDVLTAGSDATCSTGTTIYSADNVPAIPALAAALDVTGTAGETLAAGDVVYLSDGSASCGATAGRWYLSDADATCSSTTAGMVGVVPSAIASAASGSIRLQGRITGLSALTAGDKYYVSATAGDLTATPPANARFMAAADSTTTIVVGGNPGAVVLPDSNGTHSLVITTTSDLTADRLLTIVPGDAARTVTLSGALTVSAASTLNQDYSTTASPSFNAFRPPQGRCTLTSATPVTTADVTAATTLYYALYQGNQITLYDGSTRWVQMSFAQLSIAVPASTNQMYDVFVDYTAGTPALETVAWTNDTTRSTSLALQNGVYVQTSDTDSLYVCSFRTTGVSGQTESSCARQLVWNYYNRVPRCLRAVEATASWGYSTATVRQANGAASNQVDLVVGVAEVPLTLTLMAMSSNNNADIVRWAGIGQGSTTVMMTTSIIASTAPAVLAAATRVPHLTSLAIYPAVGYQFWAWLEYSAATATTTWYGASGTGAGSSGLQGFIEG